MKVLSKQIVIFVLTIAFLSGTLFIGQVSAEPEPRDVARALSKAFEVAAKDITGSLVNISTLQRIQPQIPSNDPRLDLFREFFGEDFYQRNFKKRNPGGLVPMGLGSGFVIDQEGHILTNNHVIKDADAVKVKLSDKREFEAKVVGNDPETDIAVLKIEASNLQPVILGDSGNLQIGEWVVAAGAPFGLDNTITAGIVSAKGRAVSQGSQYEDFIQTDAAINVGNSGGPLINLDGEVIGINTMIISRSGGSQGIGFAIPINIAKGVADQLINRGRVERGWLGVMIQDLTSDLRASFDFQGEGILIGDATSGGPAEQAGIESGDILLEFDGKVVSNSNQLRNLVANTAPDTTVELKILRKGTQRKISLRLGRKDAIEDKNYPAVQNFDQNELGLNLTDITPEIRSRYDLHTKGKVLLVDVEKFSTGFYAGLQSGDVLLSLQDKQIESVKQFKQEIKKLDLGKGVRMVVENEGMKRFVVLKIK